MGFLPCLFSLYAYVHYLNVPKFELLFPVMNAKSGTRTWSGMRTYIELCYYRDENIILYISYLTWITRGWRICLSTNLVLIDPENGFSSDQRKSCIWTNAGFLIWPLATHFSEIWTTIHFSTRKMNVKMGPANWWPFYLGLIVLKWCSTMRLGCSIYDYHATLECH